MTITFCFHHTALSCFVLNETFELLRQQKLCILDTHILDYIFNSRELRAITLADKVDHSSRQVLALISSECGLFVLVEWLIDNHLG